MDEGEDQDEGAEDAQEGSGGEEGEEGDEGDDSKALTKAGANGALTKGGKKGVTVTPGEGIHKHFTPGPHGHDVYASHLPHKSHQHAVESIGNVYEHGWDPSHTKSLGHLATFGFAAFSRWMGYA